MRIVIDLEAAQSPTSRNRGIGRYSTALAKAMLRQRGGHEILVALNGMYADTVGPVRETFDGLLPQSDIVTWHAASPPQYATTPERRRAFETVRDAFFATLHADVVHVASLFESGPFSFTRIGGGGPGRHRTAVTLYDLIPHINRDVYLFREEAARDYDAKLAHLRRADLWLAISESSRREGIEHLALPEDRVVNISSAADEHFVPGNVAPDREVHLRVQYDLWKPYVMYTGGIDRRKNIEGLIEAWAHLPEALRQSHQLAIVCSAPANERARLEQLAHAVGLFAGDVVFTGFVPEDDLVDLYRLAKLFVFPSLHEGFGLPALEAMSCGVPVIGADNSSIPEVIDRADALFDASSRDAIAAKLQQCLVDDAFRSDLVRHGLEQSQRFSWDRSARVALDAIEALGPVPPQQRPRPPATRPRLAYVAPLPPERSGIADYSAELLPALAKHYDIDAIVLQPEVDPTVAKAVTAVRDARWFLDHGEEYDRVLYHVGNSQFHEHMPELLRAHPGTVVLHDFYLSGMQAHRELVSQKQPHWSRALYESHGWHALAVRARAGDLTAVIMEFPANFEVLREAQGVIVHSPYSRELALDWYGPHADDDWRDIPHLRVPLPREREHARSQLGLAADDFLVCSFGIMGPTKLNDRLLRAWERSSLAADPHCHLVFVGQNDAGEYGRELLQVITALPGERARITGWADADTFRRHLNAADLAVQLRTLSRGETSGTVLDAMNHGIPVVANANGSMAFLPREAVHILDDEFADEDLVHALEALRADAALRRSMGEAGRRIVETRHSPHDCAAAYALAIEEFAQRAGETAPAVARAVARELPAERDERLDTSLANAIAHDLPPPAPARQLLVDIGDQIASGSPLPPWLAGLVAHTYPGWRAEPVWRAPDNRWRYARQFMLRSLNLPEQLLDEDLVEFRRKDVWCFAGDAKAALPREVFEAGIETLELPANADPEMAWAWVAANTREWGAARCWVDISELVRHDWQSGIQRVVKNHLLNLLRHPPAGQIVLPVYATTREHGYRVARRFLCEAAGIAPPSMDEPDPPINARAGDTFFGLDLLPHLVPLHEAYFRALRGAGVRLAFMVYDLLPIRLPDCFHPDAPQHHARWLDVVAQSDLAVCISGAVADELREWLAQRAQNQALPEIRHVHLGADIEGRVATRGMPADGPALLERLRAQPSLLMVGTIEPRKAHAAVLAAFERLWAQGVDCMLVIAGRPGWMADELMAALRSHPESGRRLVWLDDASDEFLEAVYGACAALLLASRGEGFGLPLVEAAQRGLPLIARDLPVFREVAGDHAWYFRDDSPQALADAIRAWLALHAKGEHPRPQGMRWLTWKQSTARLRRLLELDALRA